METRSVVAEMFIGMPTHFWVLPVAGLIAWFGLKWAEQSDSHASMLRAVTYLLHCVGGVAQRFLCAVSPFARHARTVVES